MSVIQQYSVITEVYITTYSSETCTILIMKYISSVVSSMTYHVIRFTRDYVIGLFYRSRRE